MADFAPFTTNAADRRLPILSEISNGMQCGPADRRLMNGLWWRIETELRNLILGAGINPTDADMAQIYQAVVGIHRQTQSVTITVPGDYPTLQACLDALSHRIIPTPVDVTISLGAGDHIVNESTPDIILQHPFGIRISIVGQPLLSAFPTFADVDNASAPPVETALRAKFPTRIVMTGQVRAGIYMRAGVIRSIENILFIGDGTVGQHGLLIGEWQGELGMGGTAVRQCWFHRCGNTGLRLNFGSFIYGYRLGFTHNVVGGFIVANKSGAQVLDKLISARNGGTGVDVLDSSFLEVVNGTFESRRNTGVGLGVTGNSQFQGEGATGITIANNTGYGIAALSRGLAKTKSLTGGGNGVNDVFTDHGSYVEMQTNVGTISMSPAANTIGNRNSYNAVS